MQLLDSRLMVWLSQELRPKVQVSYWYSLNTRHHIILSKQGYAKVDVHLPRKVILVVDCIVQEVRGRSYCTVIRQIQDVVVQDKIQRLCEWIEIRKRCSPNDSLCMVGVKVVCNIPQHLLLPAQGNLELWAVHVKVHRTPQTLIQWFTQCSMAMRRPSSFNWHVAASPWMTISLPGQQSRQHLPGPGSQGSSSLKVDHATLRMLSAAWWLYTSSDGWSPQKNAWGYLSWPRSEGYQTSFIFFLFSLPCIITKNLLEHSIIAQVLLIWCILQTTLVWRRMM